ncbi:GNAT family N-acetyltransferase [Alteraurantiacibacter buctensis]|uniref:GNAT family N-acetyltransferase n=1 Tax=Alteraurantiacibacter buctensis TaxID=1503981 RepID=A0A844Z136_9SPHN|nr:GNAT family N-acetyltransferase [Alteraurantiacibacter buctensis]MXO72691.1 GNAT family N-acetyltransferase [Alteraurantiacibacter buctensis]
MSRLAPHAIERLPLVSPPPESDAPARAQVRLVLRPWADCDTAQQRAAWDALAARTAEPNPFYESWFLLPSLRALDPQGSVSLACLEVDGQLAGLLPLRRYSSYYGYPLPHLRGWVHDNAFCGLPLVAAGMEALFWRELLAHCDAHAGRALFLHLLHMPTDSALHTSLKGLLAGERRKAASVQVEERAMLASRLSPEAYLEASLAGKKRKELRRQQRRLEELGPLATTHARTPDEVAAWVERFLALEARGWKGQAGSAIASDPANAAWFRAALVAGAEAGRVECLALEQNGQPLAMLANFITAPGAYSFKTAFAEDFARFSPGVLLQVANLALLERPEIAWTDSCAAADHLMIDHFWRERRRVARHSIAIGGQARQALFGLLLRHEIGHAPGGLA